MHIAFDAQVLGERLGFGVRTYTLNLLKSLVTIDLTNRYTIYAKHRFIPQVLNAKTDNFRVRILRSPLPWRLSRYTRLPAQLFFDKPDVFFSPVSILGLPYPARTVLTTHDLFSVSMRQFSFLAKHAGAIIAVSHFVKNELVRLLKTKPEKIYVIYEGYDPDTFKPEVDKQKLNMIKQKYNIDSNYILNVAVLEPRKNIPRLIEAFNRLNKQVPNCLKLVITGEKGWDYEGIFRTVRQSGLEDKVIFTGFVPQKDLPVLMSGAEVFVFPSLQEGFGLPPLEAMACGTPVITSNTSSLPEVIGDAGILVDPYNINEIVEAMYQVISNIELRERMRYKGLERVKMFSWEKAAKETIDVFKTIYRILSNKVITGEDK